MVTDWTDCQEGNVDDDDSDGYKVIMISLTMLLSSISACYHARLPGDCSPDDFSKNRIRAKGSSLSLFLNNLFYLEETF